MHSPTILSCGEVLWDLFPDGPRFGGAPANFACHAAILGARVSILTAVGFDSHGAEALSVLRRIGIDTTLVQSSQYAPTGTVGIRLDPEGKPSFEIHTNSAWDHLVWTEQVTESMNECGAVYFGTLGQRGVKSRETIRRVLCEAKARGILRVLDINLRAPFYNNSLLRDSISLANVLKISDEELPAVADACNIPLNVSPEVTLEHLRSSLGMDCIAMTRGKDGALMVSDEGTTEQHGIPAVVVDTVGAGDSFTAALVLGLLRRQSPSEILRIACQTASTACSHAGGIPVTL